MTGFPQKVRDIVKERANHMCERCGKHRGAHLHHRRPRGMGGSRCPETNQPSAGLWICVNCHGYIETYRSESFAKGWLVRQGVTPSSVPVLYRRSFVLLSDDGCIAPTTQGETA